MILINLLYTNIIQKIWNKPLIVNMHINTKSTYSRKVNFMLLYASLNKNWPLIWLINKSLSFLRCGFISDHPKIEYETLICFWDIYEYVGAKNLNFIEFGNIWGKEHAGLNQVVHNNSKSINRKNSKKWRL